MRVLTLLVVVMGMIIVAGVAVLVTRIAGGVHSQTLVAAPPVELPKGARIERMAAGPDRIVLEIALADGSRQLLVLDLASGRKRALIPLREAP